MYGRKDQESYVNVRVPLAEQLAHSCKEGVKKYRLVEFEKLVAHLVRPASSKFFGLWKKKEITREKAIDMISSFSSRDSFNSMSYGEIYWTYWNFKNGGSGALELADKVLIASTLSSDGNVLLTLDDLKCLDSWSKK